MDPCPNQIAPEQVQAPYLVYRYRDHYEYDSGLLSMPLSGLTAGPAPPSTLLVVQARRAATYRIVEFEIVRVGDKPVLPSLVSPNPNEVLLSASVTPQAPVVGPDGCNFTYGVSGRYVYAVLGGPVIPGTDPLRMGSSPTDTTTASGNVYDSGDFDSTIQ
jgi:hypothetical protein